FVRQMRAAGLGGVDIPEVQQVQTAGIQRSIRLESQALWALCVLIGLAGFAIVGQSLARQTYLDSADLPALWALGFSRVQLFSLGIVRAAIIGTASACVVVPVAVLLSPLTPVGLARIAEPDPGFAVDAGPLVLGAALTASLVLAASLGHLLTTPRLAGFTWDAFVSAESRLPKAAAALRADPKIAGYTRGGFTGVRIGQVKAMALVLGRPGPARPVITAGVAPAVGDEIALGAATMRAANTAIGRTVAVTVDQAGGHPKPVRMR